MYERPCKLLNYLYRRGPIEGLNQWFMKCYKIPDPPSPRVPGFVEEEADARQVQHPLCIAVFFDWRARLGHER